MISNDDDPQSKAFILFLFALAIAIVLIFKAAGGFS